MMIRFVIAIASVVLSISSLSAQTRTFLTPTTRDFYVSTTGNDANDCRLATPCATIQRAVNNVKQNYDSNCLQAWIRIFPGTYAGWEDYEAQTGCQPKGGGPTVISGITSGNFGSDCVDPANVHVIGAPGVNAVSYDGNAKAIIICMTISSPGASPIYATNGGILEIGLLRFGSANVQIMADANGSIFATSTLDFVQGATYGMYSNFNGQIHVVPGITMKFGSGIGYSQQFAFAINDGKINLPMSAVNVVGNPTGQKCYASIRGLINSGGVPNSIPGVGVCGAYSAGFGFVY